jgi:hypothetical protein
MEGAAEFDKRRLHQKQEEEQELGAPSSGSSLAAPARAEDTVGGGGAAAAARLLRNALAAARRAQNGGAGGPGHFVWPGRSVNAVAELAARGAAGGWLVAPTEVELGILLGAGAFGSTYRARWHGADVAVKRVRVETDVELSAFLREVECLSGLRHPGIVPFLGAVLQVGGGGCGGAGKGAGGPRGRQDGPRASRTGGCVGRAASAPLPRGATPRALQRAAPARPEPPAAQLGARGAGLACPHRPLFHLAPTLPTGRRPVLARVRVHAQWQP